MRRDNTNTKRSPRPRSSQLQSAGEGYANARRHSIELLVVESLTAMPWLVHGFSTRPGGESRLGGERVLNLGFTDWDTRERVTKNRGKLRRALAAENHGPRWDHGIIYLMLRTFSPLCLPRPPRGDAAISPEPGLLVTVQTADCVPILLVDRKRRVVAAVHAGWRGTVARVVVKALGRMRLEFGTRPEDVTAALGPTLGAVGKKWGPKSPRPSPANLRRPRIGSMGRSKKLALGEELNPLPRL